MAYPAFIENNREFPVFYHVRMNHPRKKLTNLDQVLFRSVQEKVMQTPIKKGDRVAVCVGSRGIPGIADMVKIICTVIRNVGAMPCIVPAMGSHGGATAQGQIKVLESFGITEEYCCAEITSSMDVIKIGDVLDGVPVYFSKDCLDMDHTICINRIKPHTKFKGPVESGIYKMLCVGIGKHLGAQAVHQAALRHGFLPVIKSAGDTVIKNSKDRKSVV
jgi:nickel-dependent lactate racemase